MTRPSLISRYTDDNDDWSSSAESTGINNGYNNGTNTASVGWNTGSKKTVEKKVEEPDFFTEDEKWPPAQTSGRKRAFYNQNSVSPPSQKQIAPKRALDEPDDWANDDFSGPAEKKSKVVLREISTQTEPPPKTETQVQCDLDPKPKTAEKHTQCCNIGKEICFLNFLRINNRRISILCEVKVTFLLTGSYKNNNLLMGSRTTMTWNPLQCITIFFALPKLRRRQNFFCTLLEGSIHDSDFKLSVEKGSPSFIPTVYRYFLHLQNFETQKLQIKRVIGCVVKKT